MGEPAAIQTDISRLIHDKQFAALKSALVEMEVHDLATLLSQLEGEELGVCFRLLPWRKAADVFTELDFEQQEHLLRTLSSQRVVAILNEMPPDDRTVLLEELPDQLAQRLLYSLRGEEMKVARSLLAYPEDSVGRIMTPEYVAISPAWTIRQVFEHLRRVGREKETLNILYVVDDTGRLLDEVYLEQLVLAEPDSLVRDLMDYQVAALHVTDDREAAVEMVMKYDAIAIPVVTRGGVLVGIVTVDDVMDVAAEETTEDFQKMSAVATLESPYFRTTHLQMLAKRLPWLMLLFLAELLTVFAIDAYQSSMQDVALVAMMTGFVPLINACAGNTGSQMAGLMIRSFATAELDLSDWRHVLAQEVLRGVLLGAVLAAMVFVTVLLFGRGVVLALGTAVALLVIMAFANVLGGMLPFLFKRIGVDPATTSGPFIASLMDVSAIIIYFTVALGTLRLLG